jgi:hypothetical protein
MIYTHLIISPDSEFDEPRVKVVNNPNDIDSYPNWYSPFTRKAKRMGATTAIWRDAPHYWDEEYVGAKWFSEMVERWYHITLFDFGISADLIEPFVRNEWPGGKPAKLVQSVRLDVSVNEIVEGEELEFSDLMYESVDKRTLVQQLRKVFLFKKRGARVFFNLMYMGQALVEAERMEYCSVRARSGAFEKVLDVLWPLLVELNQRGYVVEVRSGEGVFRVSELRLEKEAWMGKLRAFGDVDDENDDEEDEDET